MKSDSFLVRLGAVLGLFLLLMLAYLLIARPYQLTWGATNEEIARALPGDELAPNPAFDATRAITIDAPPDVVWPWVVQIGYGRAGFYGYDILENIGSHTGLRSAMEIVPEFQNPQPGDDLPLSAAGGLVFHTVAAPQTLIWTGPDLPATGQFLWDLQPTEDGQTRLISRIRWSHHWDQPSVLAMDFFTEFTDHLAVREVLLGVKGRVEGNNPSNLQQDAEFFTYVATLLLWLAGMVLLLVRPLTRTRWLAAAGLGAIWLLVWYAPGGLWLGVPLTLAAVWLLWLLARREAPRERQAPVVSAGATRPSLS